jgi:hypothetical protein
MQRAEMEELRHREANNTALQAIGPRKKLKLDPDASTTTVRPNPLASGVVLIGIVCCRQHKVHKAHQQEQKQQRHYGHASSASTCAT